MSSGVVTNGLLSKTRSIPIDLRAGGPHIWVPHSIAFFAIEWVHIGCVPPEIILFREFRLLVLNRSALPLPNQLQSKLNLPRGCRGTCDRPRGAGGLGAGGRRREGNQIRSVEICAVQ